MGITSSASAQELNHSSHWVLETDSLGDLGFMFRSLGISSLLHFIKAPSSMTARVLIAAHLMGWSPAAGLCKARGQALLPSTTLARGSFLGVTSEDIHLPWG